MSKENYDGGPAFPMSGDLAVDFNRGMSLRDYIAIKAMQSFITRVKKSEYVTHKDLCNDSYNLADSMLEHRKVK